MSRRAEIARVIAYITVLYIEVLCIQVVAGCLFCRPLLRRAGGASTPAIFRNITPVATGRGRANHHGAAAGVVLAALTHCFAESAETPETPDLAALKSLSGNHETAVYSAHGERPKRPRLLGRILAPHRKVAPPNSWRSEQARQANALHHGPERYNGSAGDADPLQNALYLKTEC